VKPPEQEVRSEITYQATMLEGELRLLWQQERIVAERRVRLATAIEAAYAKPTSTPEGA
jgi:hypothetical protein